MTKRWLLKRLMRDAPSFTAQFATPAFDSTRPLAFMHVPKTSGSALMGALDAAFFPATSLRGFDRCLFGAFSDFDSFSDGERARVFASAAALPTGHRLIAGHFAFSTLRAAYPEAQIMTVLRDPLSRLLSHWLFWRQHTDAMLTAVGDWADRVRLSRKPLAEFLADASLGANIDNVALRMLLWPHALLPDAGFIPPANDETLLAEATARLAACSFVDITENDRLSENLNLWLGRPLTYPLVNETASIPREWRAPLYRELTTLAYERLLARSRLDRRLWNAVAEQRLNHGTLADVRERALLATLARYGALMAA